MNPNSSTSDTIITPAQLVAIQQRIIQLEQLVTQSHPAQPSTEPQSSAAHPMTDMNEQVAVSALHSLEVRPSYSWAPSPFLAEVLSLNDSLFTTPMLQDEERRKTIEQYPQIDTLQYQPLDTIPVAARKMNKYQTKQDMSLKRLQYLFSGVVRPLDVLGLEISKDINNENVQCCEILTDINISKIVK